MMLIVDMVVMSGLDSPVKMANTVTWFVVKEIPRGEHLNKEKSHSGEIDSLEWLFCIQQIFYYFNYVLEYGME